MTPACAFTRHSTSRSTFGPGAGRTRGRPGFVGYRFREGDLYGVAPARDTTHGRDHGPLVMLHHLAVELVHDDLVFMRDR